MDACYNIIEKMAGERLLPRSVIKLIEGLKPRPPVETLEDKLRSAYQMAVSREGSWQAVNEILESDQTGEARKIAGKLDKEILGKFIL